MPIIYEKFPPTADDVQLESKFVSAISSNYDSDDDMVIFSIAQEDAFMFAKDIERNVNGNINLNEVRRGLSAAAESLTNNIARTMYIKGVESFIEHQLSQV